MHVRVLSRNEAPTGAPTALPASVAHVGTRARGAGAGLGESHAPAGHGRHMVWNAGEGRAPGRPLGVGAKEGLGQERMLRLERPSQEKQQWGHL